MLVIDPEEGKAFRTAIEKIAISPRGNDPKHQTTCNVCKAERYFSPHSMTSINWIKPKENKSAALCCLQRVDDRRKNFARDRPTVAAQIGHEGILISQQKMKKLKWVIDPTIN